MGFLDSAGFQKFMGYFNDNGSVPATLKKESIIALSLGLAAAGIAIVLAWGIVKKFT
jgi:hypothetical protein